MPTICKFLNLISFLKIENDYGIIHVIVEMNTLRILGKGYLYGTGVAGSFVAGGTLFGYITYGENVSKFTKIGTGMVLTFTYPIIIAGAIAASISPDGEYKVKLPFITFNSNTNRPEHD